MVREEMLKCLKKLRRTLVSNHTKNVIDRFDFRRSFISSSRSVSSMHFCRGFAAVATEGGVVASSAVDLLATYSPMFLSKRYY
ncbi:hypothetical protein OROMI_018730 [Orobanche minor]